jgi:colanic acid/amylovoran biosynthesis protein
VGADLILSAGGTYLIENYSLWTNIWDYRLSLASNTPLFFFTQTLGPFTTKDNRRAFGRIFSKSVGIAVRDERSRDHLLQLGVEPSKICLSRDAAFVIEPEETRRPVGNLRIAVSVRTMRLFTGGNPHQAENYKLSVSAMVTHAVRKFGADVTFLSTCQGIEEYWANDSIFANDVVATLPDDVVSGVTIDKEFRQPAEIVAAYQSFHLVIATRMHAAILSIVAGTPVIGIAYEFKLIELFRQLGLDRASVSTAEMSPVRCEYMLEEILNNLECWRVKVVDARTDSYQSAQSVKDNLPEF